MPYPEITAELRALGPVIEVPRTTELYQALHPATPPSDVTIERDIAYGPHKRHRLDVFRGAPAGKDRPAVVFIHGGGFRFGAKQLPGLPFHDNVGIWAARNGLVGVTISYRLAPEVTYPAGAEDMARVVEYLRANAQHHGIDPQRIFLWGHSAGGAHVADYIATVAAPRIAGVILTSGIYEKSGPASPWSDYYGTDATRYAALSPLPALAAMDLPLLVTWAEIDRPDFVADAARLLQARRAAGRTVAQLCAPGHSHISEIYAVGTADSSVSGPVLEFILSASGASP